MELLERKDQIVLTSLLVQNDNEEVPFDCVPMGEGCFHPQLGFIEKKREILQPTEKEPKPVGMSAQTFQSLDVDLVECREGNYFDIFCGQTKAKNKEAAKAPGFEIWFDVSTSLRKTDYSEDLDRCHRRSFAEVLENKCGSKPTMAVFNTSIKLIQDLSQICLLQGTNNSKRIVEWIKASKAKHLIIVTDKEEYTAEFRDFLAVENSILHGLDAVNLTADKLVDYSEKLLDSCKK